MNVTTKDELALAKSHFDAFGSLPLETITVIFELAEKQLESEGEEVADEAAKPKTRKAKA